MSKTAKRKTYEIWYNNELIDSTEDQTEALYLLNEYKLAFHSNEVILQINFIKQLINNQRKGLADLVVTST